MKELIYAGAPTGVLFGFLKEVCFLVEKFETPNVVFCFDADGSVRKDMYPDYKKKRHSKTLTEEEIKAKRQFHKQIRLLRDGYLHEMGFQNVFWENGYESDDFIARAVKAILRKDPEATIYMVTGDCDMYQLLRENVMFYNPSKKKVFSVVTLKKELDMTPKEYRRCLAIAGCSTDEVKGVKGVGIKTALKYIRKELPKTSPRYQGIKDSRPTTKRNYKLVALPFRSTPRIEILDDTISPDRWNKVVKGLGMKTLQDAFFPRQRRRSFGIKSQQ
jgi:5'-3' exonuclease